MRIETERRDVHERGGTGGGGGDQRGSAGGGGGRADGVLAYHSRTTPAAVP